MFHRLSPGDFRLWLQEPQLKTCEDPLAPHTRGPHFRSQNTCGPGDADLPPGWPEPNSPRSRLVSQLWGLDPESDTEEEVKKWVSLSGNSARLPGWAGLRPQESGWVAQGVAQGPGRGKYNLVFQDRLTPTCCVTLGVSLTPPEFQCPAVQAFQGGKGWDRARCGAGRGMRKA